MRLEKTIAMAAAAMVLTLGLTARADDDEGRRAPEAGAAQDRESKARDGDARKGDEREWRNDRYAAERERRQDREAGDDGRRRDENPPGEPGRRQPVPPAGRGQMRPQRPGGGSMRDGMGMGGMQDMMNPKMGPGMGAMMGGGPGMGLMESLRETDPEMFELEQDDQRLDRESRELAEHYRRATEGPARGELRHKLKETVAQHYKTRQSRRELEVKRLEAQLERLRGALEKRSKDAEAVIDRRVSQLLGEEDFGF
ncbi:MAG TPA: hypothetical protein VGN42_00630 [Pirellulales bacterium]|jgi:hypothetical protein|nr:hypothetical protein [Pirellulales bacterium]